MCNSTLRSFSISLINWVNIGCLNSFLDVVQHIYTRDSAEDSVLLLISQKIGASTIVRENYLYYKFHSLYGFVIKNLTCFPPCSLLNDKDYYNTRCLLGFLIHWLKIGSNQGVWTMCQRVLRSYSWITTQTRKFLNERHFVTLCFLTSCHCYWTSWFYSHSWNPQYRWRVSMSCLWMDSLTRPSSAKISSWTFWQEQSPCYENIMKIASIKEEMTGDDHWSLQGAPLQACDFKTRSELCLKNTFSWQLAITLVVLPPLERTLFFENLSHSNHSPNVLLYFMALENSSTVIMS